MDVIIICLSRRPLFLYFEIYMSLSFRVHFLSVKWNAIFLRNTLLPFVIFYVFQKFYTRRKYIRVQEDTITTVS